MLLALSLLIVLVTSFFCSLSEASLLSVSRVRIETLAKKSKAALVVSRMKATIDRPIAAILILNTIANTGGAAIAGREYERLFGGANMGLFTTLLTIAVLLFSELLPKTLGVRHAVPASLLVARPIQALVQIMRPATWLVERMSRWVGARSDDGVQHSLDDLRVMARLAVSAKALGREELMIIEAASRLPRISVSQIMIHRQDIVFLSLAQSEEEIRVRARQTMHSRVVLCHNDLDSLIGVVSVKEVLWRMVEEPEDLEEEGLKRILGEAVREPIYVTPDLEVSQLLQVFSQRHAHLALVREEERIVGVVTLEDVVEELIGEVDDEYDRSPQQIEKVAPGLWRFGGGTLWSDAVEALRMRGEHLSPDDSDIDLDGRFDLNDLAADYLRGKLRTGGMFTIDRWRFKVMRMRRGKVLRLEARMLGQPDTIPPDPVSGASAPASEPKESDAA